MNAGGNPLFPSVGLPPTIHMHLPCCPVSDILRTCCTPPAQVYGYALYKNGKFACVKYPMEGYSADVAGRSFHHGRFVQRLRYAAASVPDVCLREGTVRRLINGEAAPCCASASC
jgi:hypothetical protein